MPLSPPHCPKRPQGEAKAFLHVTWNGPQAKDMACHCTASKAKACPNIAPKRPQAEAKACPHVMWNGPRSKDMACHRSASNSGACLNVTLTRSQSGLKACLESPISPQKAPRGGQGMPPCPGEWPRAKDMACHHAVSNVTALATISPRGAGNTRLCVNSHNQCICHPSQNEVCQATNRCLGVRTLDNEEGTMGRDFAFHRQPPLTHVR